MALILSLSALFLAGSLPSARLSAAGRELSATIRYARSLAQVNGTMQAVLLKGVNDDPLVMRRPMQKLLAARVRPYYIYQADYVSGTEHRRTTVEKGLEIMENLRGWTSGLAVPYYCIDAPGGGGKIPVLPKYLQSITDEQVVLRNYAGELFVYAQVKTKPERRPRPAVARSYAFDGAPPLP